MEISSNEIEQIVRSVLAGLDLGKAAAGNVVAQT